jgi:hypothetical protein
MSAENYEAPALREVGDFDELTKCLGVGSCNDFLGCGYAIHRSAEVAQARQPGSQFVQFM